MSEAKVIIVTGAGSGIGRATSVMLAKAGHTLVLVGRDKGKLEQTAALLDASRVQVIAADITASGAPALIIAAVLARWQRIDVLVNNAGKAKMTPIAEATEALATELMRVNAIAPALLIAAVWPTFLRQQRGLVVNISSLAAIDPFPGFFAYGATKAAVESLARSVASEAGDTAIRAYNIATGIVETPMLEGVFTYEQVPADKRRAPEDVAAVVAQCVAGQVAVASGQTLIIPNL